MNHPSAVWLARATASSLLIVGSALLGGCYERPPVDTVQTGIRGIGDEQVINPRLDAIKYKKNQLPEPIPPADADGPPATLVFQNLKVLKDLNIGQFTRVMQSMAAWVAPARISMPRRVRPMTKASAAPITRPASVITRR